MYSYKARNAYLNHSYHLKQLLHYLLHIKKHDQVTNQNTFLIDGNMFIPAVDLNWYWSIFYRIGSYKYQYIAKISCNEKQINLLDSLEF